MLAQLYWQRLAYTYQVALWYSKIFYLQNPQHYYEILLCDVIQLLMFAKQSIKPNPISKILVGGFSAKFEVEEIPFKYLVSKEALQEPCQNNITTYSRQVFFGAGK